MTTDTTDTTAILAGADALLATFNGTIEQINAAGDDGAVKKLADAMAEILKAVARKIDATN